jgi:hypothetical protein
MSGNGAKSLKYTAKPYYTCTCSPRVRETTGDGLMKCFPFATFNLS